MKVNWRNPGREYGKFIFVSSRLLVVWTRHGFDNSIQTSSTVHRIQHNLGNNDPTLPQVWRQWAVRDELIHAWNGYRNHTWMSDSLRPLSATSENALCGWSATLIDTLDTLWIMGLDDEFEEAVEAISTISFNNRRVQCVMNLFEMTIRHLGGLIAAYDLSQGDRLLPKADEMRELLHPAFQTENGMPCSHCALLFRFNRDKVLQDIPQPQEDEVQSEAMASPSLPSPVELDTPMTSEDVNSVFKRIKNVSHLLDDSSRRDLEMLNNAALGALAGNSLLLAQNKTLRKQNDEKKIRKSVKSKVIGTAKVMSYRDLKTLEEKRDAKEPVKKLRKPKTKGKQQSRATQESSRSEHPRSEEADRGTRQMKAKGLANYCSVLQF